MFKKKVLPHLETFEWKSWIPLKSTLINKSLYFIFLNERKGRAIRFSMWNDVYTFYYLPRQSFLLMETISNLKSFFFLVWSGEMGQIRLSKQKWQQSKPSSHHHQQVGKGNALRHFWRGPSIAFSRIKPNGKMPAFAEPNQVVQLGCWKDFSWHFYIKNIFPNSSINY